MFRYIGGFVRIGHSAYSTASMSVLLIPAAACIIYKKRNTRILYIWLILMIGIPLLSLPHDIRAIFATGPIAIAVTLLLCNMERFSHKGVARHRISIVVALVTGIIVVIALLYSAYCYDNMMDGILRDELRQMWSACSLVGGNSAAKSMLLRSGINSMMDGTVLGLAALYGRLAACGIVQALLMVAAFILFIANHEKNCLARLLMLSCGYAVMLETIDAVLSCIVGVPFGAGLPFISYGGTGFIVNGTIVGLLLSVSNWRQIAPYEEDAVPNVTRVAKV